MKKSAKQANERNQRNLKNCQTASIPSRKQSKNVEIMNLSRYSEKFFDLIDNVINLSKNDIYETSFSTF